MKKHLTVLLFILITITSCGKASESLPEKSYHAGTDYQYFQVTGSKPYSKVQETETGCVFFHNEFVYTYNRESGSIEPICNKVNCLHDKETDPGKQKECNAHVDDLQNGYARIAIMYYNQAVYTCYDTSDMSKGRHNCKVCRIAEDGSSKDIIYDACDMEYPILHRGYIYFYSPGYQVADGEIVSQFPFMRLNVEEKNPKPELVSPSDEGAVTFNGNLRAVGNYVFFGFANDEKGTVLYSYHIEDGTIQEIQYLHSMPAIMNDKIYQIEWDPDFEDDFHKTDVIRMDYDGKNIEVLLSGVEQGKMIYDDGKYIYLSSGWLTHPWSEEDEETVRKKMEARHYWVYNKEMNLVDDFSLPSTDQTTIGPPVGGEKYQYLVFDDEETGEWGLYIWDKSEIGTLHGKAYTQIKVVYKDRK